MGWVLAAGLVVVLALAWGWLLAGAGMQMSALDMTALAGMDGWMILFSSGDRPKILSN